MVKRRGGGGGDERGFQAKKKKREGKVHPVRGEKLNWKR